MPAHTARSTYNDPGPQSVIQIGDAACRDSTFTAIRVVRVPIPTGMGRPHEGKARTRPGANKGPKAKVEWADLIGRVASQGDREAFKSLFEHFAPRVKGFMLKAGCDTAEAEEIAQDTMIAVWRKAGQFDPSTTGVAAWIFTIARNLRIDALRRAARGRRSSAFAEQADDADPADTADILMLRVEDASRVKVAIDRLPKEQSSVIKLSFIEERPHPEIATLLGIPLGTVKSRIRLAMNRLRDLLEEQ
jgi:RNA polymerase sigma factor (sigma-70 family)